MNSPVKKANKTIYLYILHIFIFEEDFMKAKGKKEVFAERTPKKGPQREKSPRSSQKKKG